MTNTLTLRTPSDFSFWRTAYSHGWCDLPPFAYDPGRRVLSRVLALSTGRIVGCTLSATDGRVVVRCSATTRLSPAERSETAAHLRSCLRMDESLLPFHAAVRTIPAFRWMARHRAGRLLRAPTVFEDAVKMICTTNCTWALTVAMVRALVGCYGRSDGTRTAFPSPAAVAATSEAALRRSCSTGYRSRSILELAENVASGSLDVESWRSSALSTPALFEAMCTVRGIGPYAAGNLLKLAGRYEYLGLDAWVRNVWAARYADGRRVRDVVIEKQYAQFGEWRGLIFWLDMTRDWHEGVGRDKFTVQKGGAPSVR